MECMPSRKRGSCSEPIGESIYLKPLFIRGNRTWDGRSYVSPDGPHIPADGDGGVAASHTAD